MNNKEQFKEAALTLARAICSEAIWHGDACNWLGASNEQVGNMPKEFNRALSTSFYDGTAGVAYFLCSAYKAENDPFIRETACGALQQVITNTLQKKDDDPGKQYGKMGFHTGYPGIAWVLWYAGEALNEKKFKDAAKKTIDLILNLPQEHWGLDVIDGAAGAIPVLLKLYKATGDERLKQMAITLGKHLIDKADKQPNGWSWDTMPGNQHNLTGYGHGTAGMAHAFAELYGATHDEQYRDIASAITAYENHHFKPQQQNWPDFRNFDQPGMNTQPQEFSCSCAWCHGAPGIGLSRLRTYALTQAPHLLQDAQIAIQTTLKTNNLNMQGNYSLCHGLFGNAELFLYGDQILQQPALRAAAEQLANECIQKYILTGTALPNGLHNTCQTPDFMLGTSGMGYFFLRLYDSGQFENMLLITP